MGRLLRAYRYIPGFRRLKRAWRSRGFGIHSPFAYRFVTRVLREDGEYYAYTSLRRVAVTGRRFRNISLIFRLVCEFRPRFVVLSGRHDNSLAQAVTLADSGVRIVGTLPESAAETDSFLYVSLGADGSGIEDVLTEIQARGGVGVWIDIPRGLRDRLKEGLHCGMTFSNRRAFLAVCRQDLPRQDFEVNF